ncbi:LysR family transcriptional regulator [Levilactobacillus bambusae]|uniref:LysR family transcriptional regulator n=1 Tax=Levilactobacillus bambusae TaxID=2024736 RepID=A0A2V1MZQ7_9LACO|nr:LysR family transcriptional regulator [Levilactobacillus bambusae]PWG00467.1 LysR family transcriptional regulator [Levilactobacillus bambusae]
MIDNYLWEELAVFAQSQTLVKTADKLHVTQPTLTRGMKKLEADLGVQLFNRHPNRISLTETGKLAAKEAAAILAANQYAVDKIQNFAQSQRVIQVGATIPGPLVMLKRFRSQLPESIRLDTHLQTQSIPDLLNNRELTLVLSNQEILTAEVDSRYVGVESLSVNLNQFMYQANQPDVTFSDLTGLSFLVLADIGPWIMLIEHHIPNAKFLYQQQPDSFSEITRYSDFPFFSTNLSKFSPEFKHRITQDDSRVEVPISDSAAHMVVYANYLKSQAAVVTPIIEQMVQKWPNNPD